MSRYALKAASELELEANNIQKMSTTDSNDLLDIDVVKGNVGEISSKSEYNGTMSSSIAKNNLSNGKTSNSLMGGGEISNNQKNNQGQSFDNNFLGFSNKTIISDSSNREREQPLELESLSLLMNGEGALIDQVDGVCVLIDQVDGVLIVF